MYKLVASDLDGTLLRSDKTISQETIDKLVELDQKGILFVPSTGRTHRELPEPIAKLPFLHYGLCVNGGEIYDYKENKCVYEVNISNEKAIEVLDYVKTLPMYPSLVIHGDRFLPADENGEVIPYIKKIAVPSILAISTGIYDLKKYVMERKEGVQKFLLYPTDSSQTNDLVEQLSKHFPDLSICTSGPLYIEVNAKGVDKGNGIRALCKHIGISTEEVIAFGDASNDIELLDAVGHAVVMENGTDETKAHADEIAPKNDEDGLKQILIKYFG